MKLFRHQTSATGLWATDVPGGQLTSPAARTGARAAEFASPPLDTSGDNIVVDRVGPATPAISPATGVRPLRVSTSIQSSPGSATQFVRGTRPAAETGRTSVERDCATAPGERRGVVDVTMPRAEQGRR
jgi:hypothetical protein